MRFTRLVLRNWKNFVSAEATIGDRLFLVGPNASGKSNLLDAFRFLRDLASSGGGFREAVGRRGGVSAIRSLAARRYSDVEIAVDLEDDRGKRWEYRLSFHQDNQRQARVARELVRCDAETILERPNADDASDPQRLTQTHLEQVNVNKPFRELATFFASIRYLHLVPQLVREPERSVGRANDPYGGDFLEQLARTPEKTRNARLRRIQNALRVAVPQLQEIELWRDARGTPHLRGKYQHWRPRGAWQTEEQFSDGTLRLMGLLWVVLEGGGPLLLEEPELSLHPEIVRHLPQMLARAQRRTGRQLFLSTHSPELLRDECIGLDEVLLLHPTSEGTKVTSAASHEEIRRLLEDGFTLADAIIPRTRPERSGQLALFGEGRA
ncbi:MAG: AAA family ATPase [Myxococcota bacterium]|nr:AAA family ATPase [Myxococcota bacterium]MDW8362747.1 AAA family ATPase [Myxococcales bacterium]